MHLLYGIQCNQIDRVNYNNVSFPLGKAMLARPFMYVNVFWLVMPTYILFYEMFFLNLNKWKKVIPETRIFNGNSYEKLETTSPIENPPDYFELNENVNKSTNEEHIENENEQKMSIESSL